MRRLAWLVLLCSCATVARAPKRLEGVVRVSSPGNVVNFEFDGAKWQYRVLHRESEVLGWSPLGITRDDDAFTGELTFVEESMRPILEEYDLPHGKRSHFVNRGTEQIFAFRTARGARVDLEVRVFDDGFGFRYRFPETTGARHTVTGETTGFAPPAGSHAYLAPDDHINGGRAAYQSPYLQNVPVGTPAPSEYGWSFPVLFRTPDDKYLLLTEAGLDAGYCATHLAPRADGGIYRIAFPHPTEARGQGAVTPSSTLPWATPWRAGIVGDRLGTIVESSLVTDLAPPSQIADTSWIKPGRASWSWWSDAQSPRAYGRLATFVDLAATFHWEYALVDEGWAAMTGDDWKALTRYAAAKNVGLLFWYESGVRRPDAQRGPMFTAEARRLELDRLAGAGARGVKIDFFESDKQDTIKLYLDILADAAARKLLVDFHGSTLPRGWERTWPNLMSMESVRGAEMYQFDAAFAQYAPTHNAMLVFTRNVVGPMDYTPVTFSYAHNRHVTSWPHELALSVVFESGVQHFADSAQSYLSLPADVRSFLATVPAAWDETRFLEGEPGKLAVLARRQGRTWWVAAINGEARVKKVNVPLDLLGNGTFDMLLLADGRTESAFLTTKRQRNAGDTQSVELRPYGGFAMRLVPLN